MTLRFATPSKGQGELQVEPIDRRVTYHHTAREAVEIWHERRRRKGPEPGEPNGAR